MTQGEEQDQQNARQDLLLDGDDRQDRGDEAKSAGAGENPVGEPQEKRPAQALDVQPLQAASREVALFHAQHPQGDPDQDDTHHDLPVAPHVPEHPPQEGADHADHGNRDEEPGGKEDGVLGRLPRLQGLILTGHVGHDQRDGGQVTGAEQDADHTPEKAAQGCQIKRAGNPFVDGEKPLRQHVPPYFTPISLIRRTISSSLRNPRWRKTSLPSLSKKI